MPRPGSFVPFTAISECATDQPMQIHLSNLVRQPNLSLASVLLALGVFGFISSGSQKLSECAAACEFGGTESGSAK
jgi:hypothetical protein